MTKTTCKNIIKYKNKTIKNYNKNNFFVAIPTYKRYNDVYEKTIKTLLNGGVDYNKIFIFVADQLEYDNYKLALPINSYHKIVIGVLGINNQRKFIVNYFKQGDCVLFVDDDVERIDKLNKNGDGFIQMKRSLNTFINHAFNLCKLNNIFLWGIYPVRNPFFMKPRPQITCDLRFILGTFYGIIIRHSPDLNTTLKEKEDVENSILHFIKDNKLLRFEKITLKTKFFNPNGGIGSIDNRINTHKNSALYLSKKYPSFGKIKIRKNGIYEFTLNNNPYNT